MAEIVLNARELVDQLWREAHARRVVDGALAPLHEREDLKHSHVLRHLNQNWQLDTSYEPGGGARRAVKQRMARFVLGVLTRYMEDERDFLANLVRMQNDLVERIDELAENIRLLDSGLRSAVELLSDRDDRFHRLLDQRLASLEPTAEGRES